jgi:rRNA maturation RNase YbeY
MILFNYETDFTLNNEREIEEWISHCIVSRKFCEGELNYIFCDDAYVHKLNIEFLKHDNFTDIISFDYTIGKIISCDIFISVERVRENATKFNQVIDNEMNRVIIHGLLHCMGYTDKEEKDKRVMRIEEDVCLKLLKSK